MTTQLSGDKSIDLRTFFAFIVPSLIGVFLFMTPVAIGEAMTIPIAVMAKSLQAFVAPFISELILGIICLTGLMSAFVNWRSQIG